MIQFDVSVNDTVDTMSFIFRKARLTLKDLQSSTMFCNKMGFLLRVVL